MESNDRPEPTRTVLTKHHGLGNDFLIAIDPARPVAGAEAVAWCDRRTGIGADGLVVATPASGEDVRRWRMVLWNADGGRAEISGNGIRCLAQALAWHHGLDPSIEQRLTIDTDAGARELIIEPAEFGSSGGTAGRRSPAEATVRAAMGKALSGPEPSDRWLDAGVTVSAQWGVDIGNPHLVAVVDSLAGLDMAAIGPMIEAGHPAGLNVHLMVVADRSRIELLVWERGVGATQACGSGACAAAWAANNAGLVDSPVTVVMPGGSAKVDIDGDEVFLIGPTVRVGEVIIDG